MINNKIKLKLSIIFDNKLKSVKILNSIENLKINKNQYNIKFDLIIIQI